MRTAYDKRQDREGRWEVYDTDTDEAVRVDSMPLSGMGEDEADEAIARLGAGDVTPDNIPPYLRRVQCGRPHETGQSERPWIGRRYEALAGTRRSPPPSNPGRPWDAGEGLPVAAAISLCADTRTLTSWWRCSSAERECPNSENAN
jgi:hypothetical protein